MQRIKELSDSPSFLSCSQTGYQAVFILMEGYDFCQMPEIVVIVFLCIVFCQRDTILFLIFEEESLTCVGY